MIEGFCLQQVLSILFLHPWKYFATFFVIYYSVNYISSQINYESKGKECITVIYIQNLNGNF